MDVPARSCWICGKPADSSEHAIKKTDIARFFGGGPYPKGKRLLKKTEDGRRAFIQSPDSTHIKYSNVLCHSCNTARTQLFDRAYDQFMGYMNQETARVLEDRRINLRRVYGICGNGQHMNLFKYFVKCFGCRLADSGVPVPTELSSFLLNGGIPTALRLTFSVFEDFLSVSTKLTGIAQVHRLEGLKGNLTGERINFSWALSYGWLTISFWYNLPHDPKLGGTWAGTGHMLALGSFNGDSVN